MKNKKILAAAIVALLGIVGFTVSQTDVYNIITALTPATTQTSDVAGRAIVAFDKCVDGDTFWVNSNELGRFKVRLSGVNTPESTTKTEFYGKEASIYTCNRINDATTIALEYDTTQKDSYDRKVVIVWLDGENFNLELVEKGYADLKYLKDTMPYADLYKAAEARAKASKLGMWNKS